MFLKHLSKLASIIYFSDRIRIKKALSQNSVKILSEGFSI
jgi:hypothetical protein